MPLLLPNLMQLHVWISRLFLFCWIWADIAESQHHFSLHPWKNIARSPASDEPALAEHGKEQVSDVYFVRHGQNIANEFVATHASMFPITDEYRDGSMTKLGVEQAFLAQDILGHRLGLHKLPPSSIRLASSLVSRAHDTVVIASEPLWRKWLDSGEDFVMEGVPAAEELDTSINSQRKRDVGEDDPVRWEDSVFFDRPGKSS